MTLITYRQKTIKHVVQHLNEILKDTYLLGNQKLYFGVLRLKEELTKSRQFYQEENEEYRK